MGYRNLRTSVGPMPGRAKLIIDDTQRGSAAGNFSPSGAARLYFSTPLVPLRLSFYPTNTKTSACRLSLHEKHKDGQKADRRCTGFNLPSASTTSLASTSPTRTVHTDKTSHSAPPIPTIPRWALNATHEEAGVDRNMKYGHGCGTSDDLANSSALRLPLLTNQPIPLGIRPSTSGSFNHSRRPPSISRDPRGNWMSTTDPAPKFSHLGLRWDAVVMSVRKESLAKERSTGSIRNPTNAATPHFMCVKGNSGVTTKIEPGSDPDIADAGADIKQKEGLRKRPSSTSSLKSRIPR